MLHSVGVKLRYVLILILSAAAVGAAGASFYFRDADPLPRYRLGHLERGAIVSTVATTGALSAVVTVQVGTQVSGRVKEILVDFNSPVKRGQLIARIDPESFEAKLTQAQSQLEAARASVLNQQALVERGRADVANAQATLVATEAGITDAQAQAQEAKRQLDRRLELARKELIAPSEKDSAQAAYDSARARLDVARAQARAQEEAIRSAEAQHRVAEAQLRSAAAQVREREAMLRQAQVDIENTRIVAPVDGVVVSRNVDVGQTVAAAFQAPVLFNIAQDLTQMQVHTNVDEADVGRVRVGQRATFTVDAFRGRTFTGQVVQVRKAGQVVQSVVTYTVVVSAPNPGLVLLPSMTASVAIEVDRRDAALKVPNAALRFRPAAAEEAAAAASLFPRIAGEDGADREWAARIREHLTSDIRPTDTQMRAFEAIIGRTVEDVRRLDAQPLPSAERSRRRRALEEQAWTDVRAGLTPEQRARADALAQNPNPRAAVGQVWVLGPDGALRAVRLRLGISDGQFTEVVEGELPDGAAVVVDAPAVPAVKPGRNRLRV